jgi:phosphatidylserine/phosphatidylglycerophosphate/cardiolipin synthase-like enzyme
MSRFSKLKNITAGLISLVFAIGCSHQDFLVDADQSILTDPAAIYSDASALDADKGPIKITFNNAYRMLYEENDKIGRADPKNPDKYLLRLINSAQATLDGAFYDIDDPGITGAFIAAKNRGVKVRIFTDTDNMVDAENPALPRKQIVELRNAGIEVKEDHRSGIMHQKFLVVDNQTVWTGSMNLTSTSLYQHNNNSLLINSPQLAADYNAEFSRMFEQNILGPNPHEMPFPQVKVGNAQIRLFFSPKGGAQAAIMAELVAAKKSIRFMSFSLTGPALKDLILAKQKAGLKIDGVMDECLSRGQYSLLKPFKAAGLPFYRDGNQALLHHKVIIIDDQIVVTGSANFSDSAENSNNENTLIIKSSPAVVSAYNQEFGRVKNAAVTHTNIPWYDNPACGG